MSTSRCTKKEGTPIGQFVGAAERLADQVSAQYVRTQILVLRRTFQEVGEELFPEVHVKIAQMAISHAARRILTEKELALVRERNRSEGGQRGAFAHMPKGYVQNGAAEKTDGKTRWTPAEERRLVHLASMKKYIYPSGMHKGHPCFSMICQILNDEFHDGQHVRNSNNCFRKHARLLHADEPKD